MMNRDNTSAGAAEERGWTAFTYAVDNGDVWVVSKMIKHPSYNPSLLEIKTREGATPLTLAAHKGYTEIASVLIKAGANINASADDGTTPLIRAAFAGHVPVVACLVKAGAKDVKLIDDSTALIRALSKSRLDVVKYLVYTGKFLFVSDGKKKKLSHKSVKMIIANIVTRALAIEFCDPTTNDSYLLFDRMEKMIISLIQKYQSKDDKLAVLPETRIDLLEAKMHGISFSESFTEKHASMPIAKFKAVSPLMQISRLRKLSHGMNQYISLRIGLDFDKLTNIPDALKQHILGFLMGGNTSVTLKNMRTARALSSLIAPVSSAAAAEPEPSNEANDVKTVSPRSP